MQEAAGYSLHLCYKKVFKYEIEKSKKMKKVKFSLKSLLLVSSLAVLFFGFNTPEAIATAPKQALKGALPVPGTSQTSNYLTLSQHGTILENDDATLVWGDDGNLVHTERPVPRL